ncbi:MAG: 3-isopropylmalate dehydrogenase [Nitrospinota bacterium]
MSTRIALLPGDGIGPDVVREAVRVLQMVGGKLGLKLDVEEALIGGAAIDATGGPLPAETLELCRASQAVLLGAVGGPQWDDVSKANRPEAGLLALRKDLELFANLRPAICFPHLVGASTLRREVVEGLDLLIVRELTGGIYFGEPQGREPADGGERAYNTMVYDTGEVARIVRLACEIARRRSRRVCSVDKANVLEVSVLWRQVATQVAEEFADVELTHMYVDNCAMQLVRDPKQFDVIVTGNLFGDILSDEAAMLTGSIGMLPSASLGGSVGLYEPVHGSAPDIAGQDTANPVATILSSAMLLRHSLERPDGAEMIERAVAAVIAEGYRTADLFEPGTKRVGTRGMGDAIVEALEQAPASRDRKVG